MYQTLAYLPVGYLTNNKNGKWNTNKIRQMFHPMDAKAILDLPKPCPPKGIA